MAINLKTLKLRFHKTGYRLFTPGVMKRDPSDPLGVGEEFQYEFQCEFQCVDNSQGVEWGSACDGTELNFS